MIIVEFLVSLAGATMMLLFAVRMVRSGIERSFGASFQRLLTQSHSLVGSSMIGVMMALVLQSSAAVTLLTAGFAASGYLSFPTGLAIVLGGDLGSALIIQVLSFELEWLIPVLLAVGGWLFVKTERQGSKQLGRILLGVAFILISLQFLRDAVAPIRDSSFLPALADYLERDFLTAFIVGAALAFVMHSSVAAILMCVTLAQIGAIPFTGALSLLLGANLGSALIPIWLARGMAPEAQPIPIANLILRGSWAVLALLGVNLLFSPASVQIASPGQSLIYAHIGFNLSLLVLMLPFCRMLEKSVTSLMSRASHSGRKSSGKEIASALDCSNIGSPSQVIAILKRELLLMTDLVESMFRMVPDLYKSGDEDLLKATRDRDEDVNETLSGIRTYVANIPSEKCSKKETKIIRGLMDYAIRLEAAGDVIAKKCTSEAQIKGKDNLVFSAEGWKELLTMYEEICANLQLARNVLISDDLESARLLVLEKTEIKVAERKSRKRHLARLKEGRVESFETSDIHLETLRAFRDINSHISAIAYPILYRNGQLLETRLIEDLGAMDKA